MSTNLSILRNPAFIHHFTIFLIKQYHIENRDNNSINPLTPLNNTPWLNPCIIPPRSPTTIPSTSPAQSELRPIRLMKVSPKFFLIYTNHCIINNEAYLVSPTPAQWETVHNFTFCTAHSVLSSAKIHCSPNAIQTLIMFKVVSSAIRDIHI